MNSPIYRDFGEYLREAFPLHKVQKISINAGFTCPNRDGSKGYGGCTYCNNQSFSPSYTIARGSVTEQIEEGKGFFGAKYPGMKYLAYFQSYTNTYGGLKELKQLYEEALSCPDIVGLIVGTRPDCVDVDLLDYFEELSLRTFVYIEYGVESTCNTTLERVNRGHTFEESEWAIIQTAMRKIPVGVHLIMGLPGEDSNQYLQHIDRLSRLPITSVKLHQLQVLKGTKLAREYQQEPFPLFESEEYVELVCRILRRLRPNVYVDRFVSQAPSHMIIAPRWGIKNYQFTHLIVSRMRERQWRQGDQYEADLMENS
ncbi:hypothetical protein IX332_000951 [Porphyromonas levii]|uniref:TIGR01212 family radical SAM protein n=1 Tax=Porphyromonas levii TaxID=28114 RepID=UPI00036145E3|nr:TIGR01212 family radical SAM protein [Porphyromonas levii]MBR8703911.1 hypothetical protein [Porphyromonas levii]MBR8729628.1 hypothetical protein [Porphyromonas levii]MBR8764531.1 hypothetical protein [Porphyromonas levii]MBR8770551.1 hypothetical protein [Porphyromonas levii]MBR8785587.1 hypothetical protein [Porphyromonas levii]